MTSDGLYDGFENELGYHEVPGLATWRPISEIIEALSKEFSLPQMTGGSGVRGWSAYSTFERCPKAYWLRYLAKKQIVGESERIERDIGTVFHAFSCLRDWAKINTNRLDDEPACTPAWLKQQLQERGGNPEAILEAWRIFEAYEYNYQDDHLVPLAVEYTHVSRDGKSTRYDLVARTEKSMEGFQPGIFVVEHKTASKFTQDMLTGWDLDGEILGEIALWSRPGRNGAPPPAEVFGPLQGVIVNIVGKQQKPQFYRALVAPQSVMTRRHLKVLNHLDRRIDEHRRLRYWPQHFAGCISRYGKCDYWDLCANEGAE